MMSSLWRKVWRDPRYLLGLGFGAGLSPWVPGTCGTLVAMPLYWFIGALSWPIYLSIVVIAFLLGVIMCDQLTQELQREDDPRIVWDEVVGYWLTLFLVPKSFLWMVIGFVLFRIFDIWKPWPIRWIDRHVHGGLGIMLDDMLAAIPAWVILQGCVWWTTTH